ncbi:MULTISPECIES: hypothetical protein [unclassified Kribbella]|uniref:hypothetical protein n=1 Tax=unclassified Kribbella TaxID=2644121 RepID=UPI003016F4F2
MRQPASSPRKVPAGTPSTADRCATSLPARPAPIDQNPPITSPTKIRDTNSSQ